jgi:hypothetical protein
MTRAGVAVLVATAISLLQYLPVPSACWPVASNSEGLFLHSQAFASYRSGFRTESGLDVGSPESQTGNSGRINGPRVYLCVAT